MRLGWWFSRWFAGPGAIVLCVSAAGCGKGDSASRTTANTSGPVVVVTPTPIRPDEPPALVTSELPFKYPAALYARKAQGNVTLKLFIDRDGRVAPESIRVAESSGFPALDSAAVAGASVLRFVPAKAHGEPIPVTVLFPVLFRHPEAPPLPGDTVLRGAATRGSDDA